MTWMEILKLVPMAALVALISLLGSLAGTWIGHRGNNRRLGRQNLHALRRDAALTFFAEHKKRISEIATTSILRSNDSALEYSMTAAKLGLVLKSDTSLRLLRLTNCVDRFRADLERESSELSELRACLNTSQRLERRARKEMRRIQLEIDKLVESGAPNELSLKALRQSLSRHKASADFQVKQAASFKKSCLKLMADYADAVFEKIQLVNDAYVDLLTGVREDLELTTNVAEYRALLRETHENQRLIFSDHLEKEIASANHGVPYAVLTL